MLDITSEQSTGAFYCQSHGLHNHRPPWRKVRASWLLLFFFKALKLLKGTPWIQTRGSRGGRAASSPLSSHLRNNLSSGNLTQRLTQHILSGINLLPQHRLLLPAHYSRYPALHPLSHLLHIFALSVSTFDVFFFASPCYDEVWLHRSWTHAHFNDILILNTVSAALSLPVLEFAVEKGTSLEMRLVHSFSPLSIFPCCLLSRAIPPVELKPHLQLQPFFLLLLTHSSSLSLCPSLSPQQNTNTRTRKSQKKRTSQNICPNPLLSPQSSHLLSCFCTHLLSPPALTANQYFPCLGAYLWFHVSLTALLLFVSVFHL